MATKDGGLDAAIANIIAFLDAQIGELEARGWLRSAAKAEDLVCALYDDAGVVVPNQRADRILSTMSIDLERRESH